MDIEGLRKAVTDKRFILSANPDWREGRACGLTDDKTEQKANDALTIILENIAELVVAYLIDARQPVKSEEVQREIDRLSDVLEQTREAAKELKEQKYAVNVLPVYNQIKSLELQITALQAYQPWIPVGERLPEKRVEVLTYRESGYCKVLRFETDGNWYDSYNDWESDVTHWKPLPEPPKGE